MTAMLTIASTAGPAGPVATAAQTIATPTVSHVPLGWVGAPRLLAGTATGDLTTYRAHTAQHGEAPWPDLPTLLQQLDAVELAGRGGAGFRLAAKIRALRPSRRKAVVVNGCEGEPASAKDTALLLHTPQLVLDGAAAIAAAIGARRVHIAVTEPGVEANLATAIASRPDAGRFQVTRVPARFVAGEARALIAALDGRPGVPPGRRVPPTEVGVGGLPTLLSNAETFAQVAILIRRGPSGFATSGTAAEPGTTLLTVTGAVASPGVVEVPLGTSLEDVASVVGAGSAQAVVVGGFHGAWLPPDGSLPLSRSALSAAGGTLGAGAAAFVGSDTCALSELARVTDWLAAESTRRCGPCAFGLPALAADVRALAAGSPDVGLAQRHARLVTGRGACAHPDGAARFVISGLRMLGRELELHRRHGGCGRPDRRHLATTRAEALGMNPTGGRP